MFAPMCHICTHAPCFLNATEVTQFSGSRHFQVFLPAPLSSYLFLPTTFRLALVVRLYLPLLTVPCVQGFTFDSLTVVSKIACPSSSLVARGIKRSINTSLLSLELLSGHLKICFLTDIEKIFPFFIIGSERFQNTHQNFLILLETSTRSDHYTLGAFLGATGSKRLQERASKRFKTSSFHIDSRFFSRIIIIFSQTSAENP